MRQKRKPEAGKYKDDNAEHPIWIFDGSTYSLVRFVFQCGRKRHFMPQLARFSFVLDRIVHLPIPSESFSRRGKRILESLLPTTGHDRADETKRGALQRKIKKTMAFLATPAHKSTDAESNGQGILSRASVMYTS